MTRSDVIIAGGGVIGLMTGWMLARAGVAVMVIDSGMPAATTAAAGMLAPSFEKALHRTGDDLVAFSNKSLARWPDIAALLHERSGVDCDLQAGVLSVAFDEGEAAAFEKDAEGGEWLSRDALLALEPGLSPKAIGARYAAKDGQVDPRLVRVGLARALLADGGRILRGKSVAEIRVGATAGVSVVLSDSVVFGASHIIVATGAKFPALAGVNGPLLPEGCVFPVKGEALAIERPAAGPSRVVRTARAYLCPKADGRLVIGASEIDGDRSLNPDAARVAALRRGANDAFAALAKAKEIDRWAGLRPATKDGAPIIGAAAQAPGVLFALGHYRNGVLLAPATADALVRLIAEGVPDPMIAAFGAARFTKLGDS